MEKIKNFGKGLFRETLQSLPALGTLVTNYKSTETPKGKILLSKWDKYRIVIGLIISYNLFPDAWTEAIKGLFGL